MNPATPSNLPPLLVEIEQLIGWKHTLALVKRWGGVRLYVPAQGASKGGLAEDHPLVEAVGEKAAKKLAARFGGVDVAVPRAVRLMNAWRHGEIVKRYDAGESAPQLARKFQLTERQIRSILAKATRTPPAAPQFSLFDAPPSR